jgi:hypothetical protein
LSQADIKKQESEKEKEVDLGAFFTIAGRTVRKIGTSLAEVFDFIYIIIINFLLFIKRNLIWLALSAILGFSFGFYKYNHTGPSYYADMTVSTNFESSRLLYQKIDYFNALIREGKRQELSTIFNINEQDAGRLISFDIKPVDDPLQQAKLYKDNFLNYKHNGIAGADTNWIKTLKYDDFIRKLTKYDYPLHTIRLYSKNASIYPKIQQGILKQMQENETLRYSQSANTEIFKKEEEILSSSLSGLDSLRKAYNKKIMSTNATGSRETSGIIVGQQGSLQLHAPEIELYDKELALKDELIDVKRRSIEKNNIIQVYSDFNNVGTRVSKLREDFIIYTEVALLAALILLLLVRLYRFLDSIEDKVYKKQDISSNQS